MRHDAEEPGAPESPPAGEADAHQGLVALALLAGLVGVATGFVGALFRICLDQADGVRDAVVARVADMGAAGLVLLMLACGAATLVAAWLVRRFSPFASGSGIPHVEAVIRGQLPPGALRPRPSSSPAACSPSGRGSRWGARGRACRWARALPCSPAGSPGARGRIAGCCWRRGRARDLRPPCGAMLVTTVLRNPPIYDSLRERIAPRR